jgi:hypothetical protein
MPKRLIPQRVFLLLLAAAIALLIASSVSVGLGELLRKLGDETGGKVLKYIALGCGVLLVIDLVCLVLAQAVNAVADDEGPPDGE